MRQATVLGMAPRTTLKKTRRSLAANEGGGFGGFEAAKDTTDFTADVLPEISEGGAVVSKSLMASSSLGMLISSSTV